MRKTAVLALSLLTIAVTTPALADPVPIGQWLSGGQEYYPVDDGYRPYYQPAFQSYYLPNYSYFPFTYNYYSPYFGTYFYRRPYPGNFRYAAPGVYHYRTVWRRPDANVRW